MAKTEGSKAVIDSDKLRAALSKAGYSPKAPPDGFSERTIARALSGKLDDLIGHQTALDLEKVLGFPSPSFIIDILNPKPVYAPQSAGQTGQLHKQLLGPWHLWHYILEADTNCHLLTEAKLIINEDRTCRLTYPNDPQLKFNGKVHTEAGGAFLITASCETFEQEQRVFRSKVRYAPNITKLKGIWLGLDCNREPCCSNVIFSKERVEKEQAEREFSTLEPRWLGKIKHEESRHKSINRMV